MEFKRISIDTSKHIFTLHGVDDQDRVTLRRELRRGQVDAFFAKLPPVEIALEACAGARHWGRVLGALGHRVKLILWVIESYAGCLPQDTKKGWIALHTTHPLACPVFKAIGIGYPSSPIACRASLRLTYLIVFGRSPHFSIKAPRICPFSSQ